MDPASLLFYILAFLMVVFAFKTITSPNPVFCALYLAITMVLLAFVFFTLNAYFIGGVQLIVYAGAVMVLFVMVLMLFDLKKELQAFSKGLFSGFVKLASTGMLAGLLIFASVYSTDLIQGTDSVGFENLETTDLALLLFSNYLVAFEALGLLLLVVAVGAVALARMKGGTHAQH